VLTDAARSFAVIVGGSWNGSTVANVSLSVTGLNLCCDGLTTAYYTDANLTRSWQRIAIGTDSSGGAVNGPKQLVVPTAFGATFLPTRAAPALVLAPSLQPPPNASTTPAWSGLSLENIPRPLHWDLSAAGSYVDVEFELFAPWQTAQVGDQATYVTIEAPTLKLNESDQKIVTTLPARVRFSKPVGEDAPEAMLVAQGSRYVRVSGVGVMPLKRWVVVRF
jgi:hypothetical protein